MPRRWSDKFDVPVTPGPVANHVRAVRQRGGKANAQNTKILGPRIEAHLLAYEVCLQELGAIHAQIGDHSDLEPRGEFPPGRRLVHFWAGDRAPQRGAEPLSRGLRE